MIEFLFAVTLGVGSVVLATISLGELASEDKKEEYKLSIPTEKVEALGTTTTHTIGEKDGSKHTYSINLIRKGNEKHNELVIGDKAKPLLEAVYFFKSDDGNSYEGRTKDPLVKEIADLIISYEPAKIDKI